MTRLAWLTAFTAVPCVANAANVDVNIANIRNNHGHVLVAICSKVQFLSSRCDYVGSVDAKQGSVSVTIANVRPGGYAVQAFHDENDNRKLDQNVFGMPTEGMGFSNNASFHFGPPSYSDAQISVANGTTIVEIQLKYY